MNQLLKRTLTGLGFGIVVFGSLFAGSFAFLVFYAALLAASIFEFYKLCEKAGYGVQKFYGITAAVIVFILMFGYASGLLSSEWLAPIALVPVLMMIIELYRKKGKPFDNSSLTLFGIIYTGVPFFVLPLLVFPGLSVAGPGYYPGILAGVIILIMVNDTVAFLVGVPLGKHRLFESVSPKKSWEGSIGGLIASLASGYFMGELFGYPGKGGWVVIAFIVVVFGVYGDLVESQFKRGLGVKDSGNILPGHGGVMDRVDAWLFVMPAVWVFLNFI